MECHLATPPKSNHCVLDSKWMFIPNLKEIPSRCSDNNMFTIMGRHQAALALTFDFDHWPMTTKIESLCIWVWMEVCSKLKKLNINESHNCRLNVNDNNGYFLKFYFCTQSIICVLKLTNHYMIKGLKFAGMCLDKKLWPMNLNFI